MAAQSLQLHVSEKEAEFLEKATKGQRTSCLWYDHRVGQITASTIGKVVKCAERKFLTSIVNSIMQYKALNPHILALRWETQNEDQAKIDYKLEMEKIHSDFQIHAAGLLVSTKYPFMGATPDGIVS